MEYNMNFLDITIRYILMMLTGMLVGIFAQPALIFLALYFFLQAILGWCPLYAILGINTCTFNEE